MKRMDIDERAQEVAHEFTAACRNRPETMSTGHGKACQRLARAISAAMHDAFDAGHARAVAEMGPDQ